MAINSMEPISLAGPFGLSLGTTGLCRVPITLGGLSSLNFCRISSISEVFKKQKKTL